MTQSDIIFDLDELETPLRLARVSVNKGYLSAAIAYLNDIESEAIRIRKGIEELSIIPPLIGAHFHPNDPAFVPPAEL